LFRSEGYEMRIDVVTISTQVNRIFTSVAGQLDPQPSNPVKRSETSQHVWSFLLRLPIYHGKNVTIAQKWLE
jgi:hypothetical protein